PPRHRGPRAAAPPRGPSFDRAGQKPACPGGPPPPWGPPPTLPRLHPPPRTEAPSRRGGRRPGGPSGRRRDPPQEAKLVEHLSQTQRDTRHRFVGDRHGEAGLLAEELVQATEEGPATGEDGSLVDDVGRELGRDPL